MLFKILISTRILFWKEIWIWFYFCHIYSETVYWLFSPLVCDAASAIFQVPACGWLCLQSAHCSAVWSVYYSVLITVALPYDLRTPSPPPASFFVFKIVLDIPRSVSSFHNPMNLLINLGKWNLYFWVFLSLNMHLSFIHFFFFFFLYSSEKNLSTSGSCTFFVSFIWHSVVFVGAVFFLRIFFNVLDIWVHIQHLGKSVSSYLLSFSVWVFYVDDYIIWK